MLPRSYKELKIKRCETDIDSALAQLAIETWEAMLRNTRYRIKKELGLDGTIYHFSMRINYQTLAGKVWSPSPNSTTGRLVAVSETMVSLCEKPSENLLAQLRTQVRDLKHRLGERTGSRQ